MQPPQFARPGWFAWVCHAAMLAVAAWFWNLEKHRAATGTLLALLGCLALVLTPRERMPRLPWRIRALPRPLDAVPALASLLSSPGYGLNWFYGANPYDEVVHLLSGVLAGAVVAALLLADGALRSARRLALLAAGFGFVLGAGWEVFEWATGLIGDWTDTWTDVALTMAGTVLGALGWRWATARGMREAGAGWAPPVPPLGPAAGT
ncbi:DUF2238 domain-containing protein [Paracraurococcus lichenis]|uniref:DUF2238 domain-containing protein n=1 Tax=Paracraurococcus lichenis TaxID=3064888 RepID=A0ABT9DYR5_9PROT|nr:DUF2238 domain-containing protein [Paracraurococcus sp. LOR1-02]MDO9709044.1 DUF2238 domain-containing protein [Paracraurococcus sp. LOR1-02]